MNKFVPGQRVIIEDFLVNGSRMNIDGTVMRYVYNSQKKLWNVETCVNETYVYLPEEKLVDFDEFWDAK